MARIGATAVAGGTRFEVWAPNASAVQVRIEGCVPTLHALAPQANGVFSGVVGRLRAGSRYRFVLAAAWDTRRAHRRPLRGRGGGVDVRGDRTVRRFPLELANRALLRRLTTVTARFGLPPTLASDHERR